MSLDKGPSNLSAEEFLRAFTTYFDRDPQGVSIGSNLVDDLGFDSLDYFELLVLFDSAAGSAVPEAILEHMVVVSDVHVAFNNYVAHQ